MKKQNQATSNKQPTFEFVATKLEKIRIQYLRATHTREVRSFSLIGGIILMAFIVFMVYIVAVPSEKMPSMMQAWVNIRFFVILPGIVLMIYVIARSFLLSTLDSEWAWNSRHFGGKVLKDGDKYGSASKSIWTSQPDRNHSKNSFYFDERLGWKERVPVDAMLYTDRLEVSKEDKKCKETFYLKDAYKEFWGAGLVVLRFKTKKAPRDIVLSVKGWSVEETESLEGFLDDALPLWCRKYSKRLQSPFSSRRRAFLKHPIYDRWDYKIPLIHRKAEVVHFQTPSESYEGELERLRKL